VDSLHAPHSSLIPKYFDAYRRGVLEMIMNNDLAEEVFAIHIPKSGGLTFYDVLRRAYGRRSVFSSHDGEWKTAFASWKTNSLRCNARVYYGHFPFGVHRLLDAKPRYITMLREPVDRFLSLYYYLRQSPSHPSHSRAKESTLTEFVLRYPGFCNQQSRFLAGFGANGTSVSNAVAVAIENSQHFLAVGLTSSFDASLILFAHHLGWRRTPFYSTLNASKRNSLDALTVDERRAIEHANAEDIKVYKYYQQRFQDDQVKVPSFSEQLASYSSLNKKLALLYSMQSSTRSLIRRIKTL